MGKGKRAALIVLCVVLVVVVAATAGVVTMNLIKEYKKSRPFKFSEEVSVEGIDISGLSYEDALKKLKKNSMKTVKEIELTVGANEEKITYTKDSFAYNFEYKKALDEAKIYSLKEQGIYEPENPSEETKRESLAENPDFDLSYTVNLESVEENVKSLAKKVNKKAVNARVSKFKPFASERFTYKDAKEGYKLRQEDLNRQIISFFDSGRKKASIEAKVEVLKPEISLQDVKDSIVGLASVKSYSTNNANGNSNMATALKACNGSIIEPGEIWSFNGHTGNSNLESNGYKKAQVISDKKIEEGVGGGICQASTTIYQCALFSNMTIVERHNHYWASNYAYAGEDATIDYPNLDLRLKNTTDYQMFMECKMEGSTLSVNIYGYQDPGYDNIKIYTQNYDIKKGKSFKTRTIRVFYLDHKIVKEEPIWRSTYSLTDDHSVKDDDEGTFLTGTDGRTQQETEPPSGESSGTNEKSTEGNT